ncbi:hypothetical protein CIRG_07750 [Coccidioides immitis RMSCC 2394]|uniref:Uncharacterized protein n=1 Tax=Coccidioides immitis RMSCC 2394 TaxID=404692 RepID=A0A0J6YLQ9_COCIT|nr:hypothetical protein CIRG_07750 [Coccidioides immitis RMSCC 2394]
MGSMATRAAREEAATYLGGGCQVREAKLLQLCRKVGIIFEQLGSEYDQSRNVGRENWKTAHNSLASERLRQDFHSVFPQNDPPRQCDGLGFTPSHPSSGD